MLREVIGTAFGQCRKAPACWPSAELGLISRARSERSMMVPGRAAGNAVIDRTRRRAADLGTRQV
jgi:hypothetical protein